MSHPHHHPTNLQTSMDSIQKLRDAALSKKNIATQRLQIAQEDLDAITKTIQDTEEQIKNFSNEETQKQTLDKLETEIQELTQEYQFSHTELVQKRNKMEESLSKLQKASENRQVQKKRLANLLESRRRVLDEARTDARTIPLATHAPLLTAEVVVQPSTENDISSSLFHQHLSKALDYKLNLLQQAKADAEEETKQAHHLLECYLKNLPSHQRQVTPTTMTTSHHNEAVSMEQRV